MLLLLKMEINRVAKVLHSSGKLQLARLSDVPREAVSVLAAAKQCIGTVMKVA